MLLGEPPRTQGDVHFRLFGIPVRIHPFFWITTLLLGMGGFQGGKADPVDALVWVAVVLVSILVHEMGHATMQRAYGGHPWITLYGLGGLASCSDCDRSPWRQIIISLAGPVAGFLLAAFVLLAMWSTGYHFGFITSPERFDINSSGLARAMIGRLGPIAIYFKAFDSPLMNTVIWDALQVNILWGVVNLIPVYPLDGGQIARELFTLNNPRAGIIQSLQLSAGVAVLIAVYGLTKQNVFLCLMFGYLAFASFNTLQMYRNHWR
jgi:stage IV sporulation protein FB